MLFLNEVEVFKKYLLNSHGRNSLISNLARYRSITPTILFH